MTQQAHVQALADKHATLERVITQETKRPSPDTLRIAKLKREKLLLKEKMRFMGQ
ncbi:MULTISPECIES: DUF465 domain-containing protein [Iodidimonas]|jgi:hypothetical protein|uniref:DUF465 domain-containing protein n=1 Tax=Iodidimonas nitroreducens TaxID=1236968 RepID=A0A5A7NBR0_9PROT|nr:MULTISPECIES: DUF465 domain-containing protein [Iodidimonas]GAK33461.1 hypothetical protein AQ1_01351 [alpha proteobacterium Q-1]GER04396.1 hypothetical protein JCM17846_20780 [Iodidimonas nitroreducens]